MAHGFKAFIFLLALCPALSACGTEYSAQEFEAWVVDAETGQPLEGVVAVANWQLDGGVEGSTPLEQLKVMETVTGNDGRVYFPAWGPIRSKHEGRVRSNRPGLTFFKSGYKLFVGSNYSYSVLNPDPGTNMRSDYHGKTIKIERFRGNLNDYSKTISFIKSALGFIDFDCNWKQAPRMILALDAQRQLFRTNGIDSGIYSVDDFDRQSPQDLQKCGSGSDFFRTWNQ